MGCCGLDNKGVASMHNVKNQTTYVGSPRFINLYNHFFIQNIYSKKFLELDKILFKNKIRRNI